MKILKTELSSVLGGAAFNYNISPTVAMTFAVTGLATSLSALWYFKNRNTLSRKLSPDSALKD